LIEKFAYEVLKRLSYSPAAAVGKEKSSRFSPYRLARLVPQVNIIKKCFDSASEIREIIRCIFIIFADSILSAWGRYRLILLYDLYF